jgi:TonB family protein
MRGWEGTVNVDVRLSQDGSVHGAEVVESSGYSILDQAAVDVARKSRFRLPQSEQRTTRGRIAYGFRLTPSR